MPVPEAYVPDSHAMGSLEPNGRSGLDIHSAHSKNDVVYDAILQFYRWTYERARRSVASRAVETSLTCSCWLRIANAFAVLRR